MSDLNPTRHATRQSPIALVPEFRLTPDRGYLQLEWPNKVTAHVRKVASSTDHHGTRFSIRSGRTSAGGIVLDGQRYLLRELHFHAPSEHLVDDTQFAGELHLVHQSPVDARHAVIAVFLSGSGPRSGQAVTGIRKKAIAGIVSSCVAAAGGEVPKVVEFSPLGLLPTKHAFFRYQGSLTTEPYAESVSWIVMEEPIDYDDHDLQQLANRVDDHARAIQDRDRRIVVHCAPKARLVTRPRR